MPTVNYNPDIPGELDNPSDSQAQLLVNTNAVDEIIAVDHYSFNVVSLGGYHKWVSMPLSNGGSGSIPGGRIANEGTIYTKLATSEGVSTESNLFYTPDASTNQYQLTRTITGATFNLFGVLTNNYNGVGVNFSGGWTFLPGGMLLQYGQVLVPPLLTGTVTFPITFTTDVFSIQLTTSASVIRNASIDSGTPPTTSGFKYFNSTGGTSGPLYWTAIGV